MKAPLIQLCRQLLVVRILTDAQTPVRADSLFEKLDYSCFCRGIDYPATTRTRSRLLQRDIKSIDENLHITIRHLPNQGYAIIEEENGAEISFHKLFADFDMLTSIQPELRVSEYILPEHHRGQASNNLFPCLDSIKRQKMVEFDYHIVRRNISSHFCVSPYFLKENQERWYLIADDKGIVKLFALDRMKNLEISETSFERDNKVDPNKMFEHCYGIWNDPEIPVEEIVLSYSALDGEFLKTNPLHKSQEVLEDTPDTFKIKVNLRITNDFVMALLSRSNSLEVISPNHLRNRLRDIAEACARRNS